MGGAVGAWREVAAAVAAWRRDPVDAGDRLRARRVAAGLSQPGLSARSGIPPETISRLEHGRRTPQAGTVERLADALGIAPGDL